MKKLCFQSRIVEAENGVVVKVGCQTFVGTADDLKDLVTYYKKEVPKKFKKQYSEEQAFLTDSVADMGECECLSKGGIPNWIGGKSVRVIQVANGFIVAKGNRMWVVKNEEQESDLLNIIAVGLMYKKCTCGPNEGCSDCDDSDELFPEECDDEA